MKKLVELSLYVNGMNTNSNAVYTRLTKQCEEEFGMNYSLNLFDIKKEPGIADKEQIFATPTIIRDFPLPPLRITGNLTNIRKVLLALKIIPGK